MNNRHCTCVAPFLGAMSPAYAQLEMQAPPDTRTAAVSLAPEDTAEGLIQLDVVVTDAASNPVTGPNANDFSLLENGRPQSVLSFQALDGRGARAPAGALEPARHRVTRKHDFAPFPQNHPKG